MADPYALDERLDALEARVARLEREEDARSFARAVSAADGLRKAARPETEEEEASPESPPYPPRGPGESVSRTGHPGDSLYREPRKSVYPAPEPEFRIVIPVPKDLEPAIFRTLAKSIGTTFEPTMIQLRGYLETKMKQILEDMADAGSG